MELMERVREIGADARGLSDAGVDGARMALRREIAREERVDAASSRHRRARWIGGSALAGGLAATALVIGVVAVPATSPTASAAELLERAAQATLTAEVLSPAPGQYIQIEEISRYELGWASDASAPGGGWWDSRSSATSATVLQTRALYVPADRSADWVRDYNVSTEVLEISGPDAETAGPALSTSGPAAGLGVEVYPGGQFTEPELAANGVDAPRFVNGMECYYDEMPREPEALVAWLKQHEGVDSASSPSCPPPSLTEPENFNLAPAELRATMFRALALTDGAKVVRTDGDITTIAFPEGGESTDWMNTVDIDTASGLMVGRGDLDDDSTWSSRIVVSIVDALPSTLALPSP